MSPEELTKKIADLKEELFNLRFRLATGQLDDVMQISKVKHDIARPDAAVILRRSGYRGVEIYILLIAVEL